jgi:hypothetical protein
MHGLAARLIAVLAMICRFAVLAPAAEATFPRVGTSAGAC